MEITQYYNNFSSSIFSLLLFFFFELHSLFLRIGEDRLTSQAAKGGHARCCSHNRINAPTASTGGARLLSSSLKRSFQVRTATRNKGKSQSRAPLILFYDWVQPLSCLGLDGTGGSWWSTNGAFVSKAFIFSSPAVHYLLGWNETGTRNIWASA